MTDVVVTGIGMVTPLGTTAGETAAAWRTGLSAPRTVPSGLGATPLADARVAVPPTFDAGARLGRHKRMLKFMSAGAVLGCVAAHEAVEAAGLGGRVPPERIGLYAANGLAAADVDEIQHTLAESVDEHGEFSCRRLGERGLAATNPLLSFKILANMPVCLVSIIECIRGPNYIFTPWEDAGIAALQEAWHAVASNEVDAAVAGAADTPAHPASLVYLRQSGRLTPEQMPASASAYLVLERAESASVPHAIPLTWAMVEGLADTSRVLASRMGCCFAAEPAVALALLCLTGDEVKP